MELIPVKRIVEMRPGRSPATRTRIVSPSATNVVRAFHHVQVGRLAPARHGARHAARAGTTQRPSRKAAKASGSTRTGRKMQIPGPSRGARSRRVEPRAAEVRRYPAGPRKGSPAGDPPREHGDPDTVNQTSHGAAAVARRVRSAGAARVTVEGDLDRAGGT